MLYTKPTGQSLRLYHLLLLVPWPDSVHVKNYNESDSGNCKRCTGIIMQALAKYSKQVYRAVIKMQVKKSNVGDL